eukprot:scaffold7139_cov115-Cylindrotheca_fusiformis.AAC.1
MSLGTSVRVPSKTRNPHQKTINNDIHGECDTRFSNSTAIGVVACWGSWNRPTCFAEATGDAGRPQFRLSLLSGGRRMIIWKHSYSFTQQESEYQKPCAWAKRP